MARRPRAIAIAVALAVGVAVLLGWPRDTPAVRRHVVEIGSFRFEPATVRAAPGDTVVWINRDIVPHTATAADGSWDSEALAPGASWSRVIPEADAGDYLCSYHPSMTGSVVAP